MTIPHGCPLLRSSATGCACTATGCTGMKSGYPSLLMLGQSEMAEGLQAAKDGSIDHPLHKKINVDQAVDVGFQCHNFLLLASSFNFSKNPRT